MAGQLNFILIICWIIADPLGYPLRGSNRSEDETFKQAGAVAQGLIEACRTTCRAIGIKKSGKCTVPKLLKQMQEDPKFILDKQKSSARAAARTALALVHAHNPELDLEYCTAGVLAGCNTTAIFAQVQGLDNRIVRMINHVIFYDKEKMTPKGGRCRRG